MTEPWSEPVVLFKKKDSNERFCMQWVAQGNYNDEERDLSTSHIRQNLMESLVEVAYFTHVDLVRG